LTAHLRYVDLFVTYRNVTDNVVEDVTCEDMKWNHLFHITSLSFFRKKQETLRITQNTCFF